MLSEKTSLISLMRQFKSARSGAVGLLLALGMPAALGVVGAATDFASISQSRSRLQTATDSAVLSIAREMTLTLLTQARIQELATAYITANLGDGSAPVVLASLQESGLAIKILATQQVKTPFNLIATLGGTDTISASALARVTASTAQNKLCMLSMGDKIDSGIFMHNNSQITAPGCMLHSNSNDKDSIILQAGAKVKANLLCSRGGINNMAGILEATLLTDCPKVKDPLDSKVEPVSNGACTANTTLVFTGLRTFDPGVYCNGFFVFGTAKVKFNPGIYVFRDGPFLVANSAELTGEGVSILLTGRLALFRAHDNAYLKLTAPTSGPAAGMLIWEVKGWKPGLNSWKNGGCGTVIPGIKAGGTNLPSVDVGITGCTNITKLLMPLKKVNEHYISANRVRELTGTIYLPQGLLLIDSSMPVADLSPFTLMVLNKLDLFDGPNLVLNSNYAGTTVPVPAGLGAIGSSQVRLGK